MRLDSERRSYYTNEIAKLNKSDPKTGTTGWKDWCLLTNWIEINVESINHIPVSKQAEKKAEKMAAVRNEYDPLKSEDIVIQHQRGERTKNYLKVLKTFKWSLNRFN